MENKTVKNEAKIKEMSDAGAHFGYAKSKRNPGMANFIFGVKNKAEVFDLKKTSELLEKAKTFVADLSRGGRNILFVGSKYEARDAVRSEAIRINMPYVASRWIGGALTNFGQIKTRIARLFDLKSKREKGELAKYTKKERLLIDREISELEEMFGGISSLVGLPNALFVVDAKEEETAVREAKRMKIPVVALLNSDSDPREIDFPIPGNDASKKSIAFFVKEIADAFIGAKKS